MKNRYHGCQQISSVLIFSWFLWQPRGNCLSLVVIPMYFWQPMTTERWVGCHRKTLIDNSLTYHWQPWQRFFYLKIFISSHSEVRSDESRAIHKVFLQICHPYTSCRWCSRISFGLLDFFSYTLECVHINKFPHNPKGLQGNLFVEV